MSPTSEGWPADTAHLGVSIQPAPLVDEPVPAEWLERPDLVEQAERLDRLAADFDLVTTLSLAGFEGGDWDYFEQELAKYGIAVMSGGLRSGLIFSRYAARGFGGLPEMTRDFEPDEVEELTYETVSKALFHFRRDVLMKHAWDASHLFCWSVPQPILQHLPALVAERGLQQPLVGGPGRPGSAGSSSLRALALQS